MQTEHGCCAVAERDAALKQAETTSQELSKMREASSQLQQQLHVMSLEKQAADEKAATVACDTCFSRTSVHSCYCVQHCHQLK